MENRLEVFQKIRSWANDRDLIARGDSKTQTVKLMEEVGELSKSIINHNREETIDAIGDIIVVLTNLAAIEGLFIEDCIDAAYKEIVDRKGMIKNGSFVKD
jgi:NTP pyrophosphatase (non-canonical NTP hydrolase)